jgi:hypothetical protein
LVLVPVVAVASVTVAVVEKVDVIAVGHGLVTTPRAGLMVGVVPMGGAHGALVPVAFMLVVHVTVVEVVDVCTGA